MLIRDRLKVPSKISDGFFRFLCPLCNEFQTAVNPNTNLARCFRCEKNFNTIDIVMAVRKCGFKDSVLFLKTLSMPQKVPAEVLKAVVAGIARPVL